MASKLDEKWYWTADLPHHNKRSFYLSSYSVCKTTYKVKIFFLHFMLSKVTFYSLEICIKCWFLWGFVDVSLRNMFASQTIHCFRGQEIKITSVYRLHYIRVTCLDALTLSFSLFLSDFLSFTLSPWIWSQYEYE